MKKYFLNFLLVLSFVLFGLISCECKHNYTTSYYEIIYYRKVKDTIKVLNDNGMDMIEVYSYGYSNYVEYYTLKNNKREHRELYTVLSVRKLNNKDYD